MIKYLAAAALAAIATFISLSSVPASAQERVDIRFAPGSSDTQINGAIVGDQYIDYVLSARGGQTMVVSLEVTGTNGTGSAFFNILPAGQDYGGPYVGSTDDDRRAEVTVPYDGDWAIRVYLMGNDRDTGKTVGYSINAYIAPAGGGSSSAGSGSSGAGLLPEEDIFVVSLSNPGGVLNVRNAPRPSGSLLGTFRDGQTLANVGGCTMSDGLQWCEVQAERGGLRGWVAARFLRLPGPGGGGTTSAPSQSGEVVTIAGVPANDILNVRSGPGTSNRIVGALGNGDQVRRLRCEQSGSSRWCEIEMMTDMRELGWINARYIASQSGQVTQHPSAGRMERVRFAAGSTGTEFSDQLMPQGTVNYVLGAQAGQDLYFRLAANGPGMAWRLYNPDGSLLDEGSSAKEYRGELWQSGDHKIEVMNQANGAQSFNIIVGIQ